MYDSGLHHKGRAGGTPFPLTGACRCARGVARMRTRMSPLLSLVTVAVLVAFWIRYERDPEVAETVLLDKGYADADDLEAARLRLEGEGLGARGRDGEMH